MNDYSDIAVVAEKRLGIPYNTALDILMGVKFVPFYENGTKTIYRKYANDYVLKNNKYFDKFNEMINAYLDEVSKDEDVITG